MCDKDHGVVYTNISIVLAGFLIFLVAGGPTQIDSEKPLETTAPDWKTITAFCSRLEKQRMQIIEIFRHRKNS